MYYIVRAMSGKTYTIRDYVEGDVKRWQDAMRNLRDKGERYSSSYKENRACASEI